MTPQLAEVGQFCPNVACEFYQDLRNASIIRYGKTAKGTQRYMCNHCGKTLVETEGVVLQEAYPRSWSRIICNSDITSVR